MRRFKPVFAIGDTVTSIPGMKGTVEAIHTMVGDRSPGYYVRWENGSRSFARLGTVLRRPVVKE
jgi:hypothetical protein